MRVIILAAMTLVALSLPAEARRVHAAQQVCVDGGDIMRPCAAGYAIATVSPRHVGAAPEVIGGRPSGCPYAFCGCGASLHLFGRIIPALNLAANWLRFPRAAPAPKMAAVRRHHVFVLEQHISGNVWLAFDANGGRHVTWLHARSITGYQIVNPSGAS